MTKSHHSEISIGLIAVAFLLASCGDKTQDLSELSVTELIALLPSKNPHPNPEWDPSSPGGWPFEKDSQESDDNGRVAEVHRELGKRDFDSIPELIEGLSDTRYAYCLPMEYGWDVFPFTVQFICEEELVGFLDPHRFEVLGKLGGMFHPLREFYTHTGSNGMVHNYDLEAVRKWANVRRKWRLTELRIEVLEQRKEWILSKPRYQERQEEYLRFLDEKIAEYQSEIANKDEAAATK